MIHQKVVYGMVAIFLLVMIISLRVIDNQEDKIQNQEETIMYLTSELIKKDNIIEEMSSDYNMIKELGK